VALQPSRKILYAHSSFDEPVLHWRQGDGDFAALPMRDVGAGRGAGERRYEAGPFGESRHPVEFFLTSADDVQRDARDEATYDTPLDAALLQDGERFDFVPSEQVSGPRREYEVTPSYGLSTVSLHSAILDADYDVRVMLPRGYDEQRFRRYPVIYFSGGGGVWEELFSNMPFDADASISRELTRRGALREVIQVAVDNLEFTLCGYRTTRARDLVPPGDLFTVEGCPGTVTGQADRFAAFLYLAWDFSDTFGRIGSQSIGTGGGAAPPSSRACTTSRSGRARSGRMEPYVLERDLHYFIGALDQQHSFPDGGSRWTEMLPFLLPATEEPPACSDGIDADGLVDADDPSCSDPSWPYWEVAPCGLGAELALLLPALGRLRRRGVARAPRS